MRSWWGILPVVALLALGCRTKTRCDGEPEGGDNPGPAPAGCRAGALQTSAGVARVAFRVPFPAEEHPFGGWQLAAGDDVVAARVRSTLFIVDAKSGAIRSSKAVGAGFDLAVAAGVVLATTRLEKEPAPGTHGPRFEGALTAFEVEGGRPRWTMETPPVLDPLVVSGERVFFSASRIAERSATAFAVALATGRLAWQVPLPEEGEILAADGAHVFVFAKGLLRALDPATGATQWEQAVELGRAHDGLATSNGQLFQGFPWRMTARRVADGGIAWSSEAKTGSTDGQKMFASGDRGVVVARKIYVHTDPPNPQPGHVGSVLAVFGEEGRTALVHHVRVAEGNDGRRPVRESASEGDHVVMTVDDHLQALSICGLSLEDLSLPKRPSSGLAVHGEAAYLMLEGDELVRVDL
ncbi:MAG: PQQ-binding-like beta-propeller repeat protein [Polyangiaceae bacterium]|nr:PQQ-binding-like beta-propeller repeat protein [Polyangiaceae bacterium]